MMQAGDGQLLPIALPLHGIELPALGSYFFQITIDGTDAARVSFRVQGMQPMMGIGPQ